ncbi:MAG: hypothetical protein FWD39_00720 [Clostridiales bacterium]|nr:hypothetical protein [Clostridiales bacterium]
MKQRIFLSLLVFALVFALASCTFPDNKPEDPNEPGDNPSSVETGSAFVYDDWFIIGRYILNGWPGEEFTNLFTVGPKTLASGPNLFIHRAEFDFGSIGYSNFGSKPTRVSSSITIDKPGIPLPLPRGIDVGAGSADVFRLFCLEEMSSDELFLHCEEANVFGSHAEVTYYYYGGENEYPSARIDGFLRKTADGTYRLNWLTLRLQTETDDPDNEDVKYFHTLGYHITYDLDTGIGELTKIIFSVGHYQFFN